MEIQLKKTGIETKYLKTIDLSWANSDISKLIKKYTNDEFILIFPFCSKKHLNKKWPHYKELVRKIKQIFKNKYSILVAPGPGEVEEALQLISKVVLKEDKPIDIATLISLIYQARFIISNDTGPAHICSHLNKDGVVLFGSHTTPDKVSIGNSNFKIIQADDLQKLNVDTVMKELQKRLD